MSHSAKRVRYVLKRNFFLLQLAEGDAVDVLAGEAGSATPEYMAQLRQKFGLDKPLPVQLAIYLKNVLSFDLGYSFRHDMPVLKLVLDRFIPTLLLMVSTIFICNTIVLGRFNDDCRFFAQIKLVSYQRYGECGDVL